MTYNEIKVNQFKKEEKSYEEIKKMSADGSVLSGSSNAGTAGKSTGKKPIKSSIESGKDLQKVRCDRG